MNSEEKHFNESDTDSITEYDHMDPSKFNEDGSFIGQYGGKSDNKVEPDATSPSALSTFKVEPDATSPSALSTFV